MAKKRKKIWVISGTHWDREWRYSADQSLLRLAEIVDDLLDILEANPEFTCFHLDGGTIVIEDYLAVRPENEGRLRKLMEQGRIYSVPWYTLPEMNTVGPEALIRNLLFGTRMAERFGGAMKTGYTATSYGQISQLPQIYQGFNLGTSLSYRGTNKFQVPPICHWEGADGSRIYHIRCFDEVTRTNWFFFVHYELVLGKKPRDLSVKYDPANYPVHMADDTLYETGFQLLKEDYSFNNDVDKIRTALRHLTEQAEPQAIGNNILALDMEDNAAPFVNLPKMIEAINKAQDNYEIVLDSLDNFVESATQAVKGKKVPVIKGELRYGGIEMGFNALLGTTQSSRTILKILNHEAEMTLFGVAEPLSAMSAILGGEFRHSLLNRAWLDLLKNHAHDSICGAAIDEAHRDMPTRFRAARAIAREVSRKACEYIWLKLDTAKKFKENDLTLTFFNSSSITRKGIVPVVVDTPLPTARSEVVEALSNAGAIFEKGEIDPYVSYDFYDLVDESGRKIQYRQLEKEKTEIEAERKLDSNAIGYKVDRHRILMEVEVPPLGYRTYALRPRDRIYVRNPQPAGDRPLIAGPGGILENEFIKVEINPNGTFDLTDKSTGKCMKGMHYFADNGSVGNAHQNMTPLRDYTVTSLGSAANISLMENNELRAVWRVDVTMPIPASADLDKRNRSAHTIDLAISSWLTLSKGSRRLEIKTKFNNQARDHRLRVMLPSDIQTNDVYAEGAFDVLKRCLQWTVTGDNFESHYPFQPMMRFIDLADGKRGLALLTKGLREYEVVDDKRRTMALTLIRGHRAYMTANRGLMTPEEYERNSGQHSLGPHEMEYAVMVHAGDWRKGNVMAEANDFNMPWRIIQGVPKPGALAVSQSMVTISPVEHVQLSAFYQSADGKGYILRVWNSADKPLRAAIESSIGISAMKKVRMNENDVLQKIQRNGKQWLVPLHKKEIATLYVTWA